MSVSENISRWKEKSKIDYIPLFIPLWLSLNAWMKDRSGKNQDRKMLDYLKQNENELSDRFAELFHAQDSDGNRFKGNFAELHKALENANIPYDKVSNKYIKFSNVWRQETNGEYRSTSIIKQKNQQKKIKIDENLYVDKDNELLFSAYIEIVYLIRCSLFHGSLAPNKDNERVIKYLYLTLFMMMERI